MRKLFATIASIALVGFIGGSIYTVYGPSAQDPLAMCRGSVVGGGAIGGPFTLIDENERTVTDIDIITKPTLIYFGYTFCPDVCPLDNARNADAIDLLQADGYDVTPVFITIDPARDTPAVLRDFTDNLHPKMIGLTGSEEQIKAASLAYKTYYQKQEGDPDYYLMDHSTFSYLMLPNVGLVDFFDRDATAQDIAKRTECFVDQVN